MYLNVQWLIRIYIVVFAGQRDNKVTTSTAHILHHNHHNHHEDSTEQQRHNGIWPGR